MDKKLTIVEEADLGLKLCESGNLEEGIKHLRIAAENNHLHAMVNLGHALKLYGDYEEAFKWTLRGATLGDKTAMSNLAIMYRRGQGCECSVAEAVKWGKKLIEIGEIADGYQEIICSYLYAEDEYQQNHEKAFEYAKEGSEIVMKNHSNPNKDDCEVVIQFALCYGFGKGTDVNEKEALKYYEYCAKGGMNLAIYNAGCIYAETNDKDLKNISRAIEYFEKANDNGYGDGYFKLGYMYHVGENVPENLDKAKYYYAKAIRDSKFDYQEENCKENLKEISEDLYNRVISGKYCPVID